MQANPRIAFELLTEKNDQIKKQTTIVVPVL